MNDDLTELADLMKTLGPRKVETKEFNAEQFDPLTVQKVIERRRTGIPTLMNCPRVTLEHEDDSKSCGCQDT